MKKLKCLCGSRNYVKLFERKDRGHNFEIIRCQDCGLARTLSPPDDSRERYRHYGINQYLKNSKLVASFMDRIIDEVTRFKKKGKLLEIGCNLGYLLEIAKKKGFWVRGVELDVKAVKYANKLLGRGTVIEGILQEIKFPDRYFDVVVMSHVIEHIVDPLDLFKEIKRMLKNDGIFVVVAPNFDSFCAKIKKEKWPGLQPKEHVWQFGIVTLKELLKRGGFEVVRIKTSGLHHSLASAIKSIKENARDNGSPKHIIYSLLNWLLGKFNQGDNMFITAIKYEK